jgi:hypothetical protein
MFIALEECSQEWLWYMGRRGGWTFFVHPYIPQLTLLGGVVALEEHSQEWLWYMGQEHSQEWLWYLKARA